MATIICIVILAAAYLLGAVPFALIIGKMHGVDIRKAGSGNVGATNVTRTVGKNAGRFCFFCDFAKGALPVALVQWFYPQLPWLALAAGAAAILGHVFPVFLKFKGGKGISTAAGAAFALAPFPLLAAMAVWVAVFFISGYVSLGSICAAAFLPVAAFGFAFFKIGTNAAKSPLTLGFFVLIAVLAIWRHRSNIKRLMDGTESSFKKK